MYGGGKRRRSKPAKDEERAMSAVLDRLPVLDVKDNQTVAELLRRASGN